MNRSTAMEAELHPIPADVAHLDILNPAFHADAPEILAAQEAGWYARTPLGPAVLRYAEAAALFGAWGPVERGHEAVTGTFTWAGSRFSDGRLVPRHDVVGVSGDLAYTVGTEHGEVRVDGGDRIPMTLRVTHVLRRIDGVWRLVHRHADFPPPDQRRTRP